MLGQAELASQVVVVVPPKHERAQLSEAVHVAEH